jgi:hypothetical protein
MAHRPSGTNHVHIHHPAVHSTSSGTDLSCSTRVWAGLLDGAQNDPSAASPWLDRLIDEYAAEVQPVLLCTPTAHGRNDSSDDAAASCIAAG